MDKQLSRCLRKHVAEFSDDLTQSDVDRLFFVYAVPLGIQERLKSAVQVFQHLESIALINFNDHFTIVRLMRELNKEKWAQDTEKKFAGLTLSSQVQTPEQESTISETGPTTLTQLPDDEPAATITAGVDPSFSSTPIIVRREPQCPVTRISNSLKRRLRLHNDDVPPLIDGLDTMTTAGTVTASSPLDELTQHRNSLFPRTQAELTFGSNYCMVNPVEEATDPRFHNHSSLASQDCCQQQLPRLTRKPSKISNHSSGYYSGVWDPLDIEQFNSSDEEDEEDELEYYEKHKEFFSPRSSGSRRSTLGSLSSSVDDYQTADDSDSDQGMSESSPLILPVTHLYPSMQSLECKMEIQVKELQKATVEKSRVAFASSVFKSYPFPSFNSNQGIAFQIHLYPVGLRSTSSCAVYLVVLGWTDRSQQLPKFNINVTVSKGEGVIRSEDVTVDVMKDSLPPTPNDASHVNIALFPSLLSHSELDQLDSKSVFIKATLKY